MNIQKLKVSFTLIVLMMTLSSQAQITELKEWLNISRENRPNPLTLEFVNAALSKEDAVLAGKILLADKQKEMTELYSTQWDNRELTFENYKMPFYYNIFGDKPTDGRSLFISLHGGGSAPAEINDRQYHNQKHLYDGIMKKLEGVYLAMRAPTNTWNMWHQDHIDHFINIIIQMAIIKEDVNPNRVYILGYSAGGDGLYQLAPRMADYFAAASMMAGHPGDASPNNLYNLPFALHMGANDAAYDRNKWAYKWKHTLDSLEKVHPNHYKHQVQIHQNCGHWMKLQDSVALVWMAKYERNPLPKKIVWRQDNRYHEQFYWLWTHNFQPRVGKQIIAEYIKEKNKVNIINTYTNSIQVLLNDQMLDLDKPVLFCFRGKKIYKGRIKRTIANIIGSLEVKGDSNYIFPSKISIKLEEDKKIKDQNCNLPAI